MLTAAPVVMAKPMAAVVLIGVSLSVAACGGSTDARPLSTDGGGAGGPDGAAATGAQPCGSNAPAAGPVRLASAKYPSAMAIDGANVYWVDSDLGTVNEVSVCGGPAMTLVDTSTLGPSTDLPAGVAVEGSAVYFTTQDPANLDGNGGAVWKVPVGGGAPTMLLHGLDSPGPIAVSGGTLYWIEGWNTHAGDGSVMRAPTDGSTRVSLASAQNGPLSLAVGDGRVVWTTSGYVDSQHGSVWETPMDGGLVDGVGAPQGMPVSVAVAGTRVFWADLGDPNVDNTGRVMEAPLDLAAAEPITLVSGGAPRAIAADGAYAYWADTQTVNKIPVAGGAKATVAADQIGTVSMAVDATTLYWTTFSIGTRQGSVMKIAK